MNIDITFKWNEQRESSKISHLGRSHVNSAVTPSSDLTWV